MHTWPWLHSCPYKLCALSSYVGPQRIAISAAATDQRGELEAVCCSIAARGRVCLVDAESIAMVRDMHARGVRGCYVHLRPPSDTVLRRLVHAQLGEDPPLGYEGPQAEALFYDHITAELGEADAVAADGLWDADITLPEDADAAYYSLMEAVADRFRSVVPPNHVWGFGRQLWDRSARVHGRRPLCVLLLGPVGVGKTSVAARLAERFGLLHINAGDLLYDEVRRRCVCCAAWPTAGCVLHHLCTHAAPIVYACRNGCTCIHLCIVRSMVLCCMGAECLQRGPLSLQAANPICSFEPLSSKVHSMADGGTSAYG